MFRLLFILGAFVALVASKDVTEGKLLEGDVLLYEIEIKQPAKMFGYAEATTSYTVVSYMSNELPTNAYKMYCNFIN